MKTKRNRVRGIRWERLLAAMICLCIMFQTPFQDNAVLAVYNPNNVGDTSMHVLVYHWHVSEGETTADTLKPTIDEYLYPLDDSAHKEHSITVESQAKEGETFSSFSFSVGQDAVHLTDDGKKAIINYNSDVHLVKVHVFYTANVEKTGVNFKEQTGEDFGENVNPEKDTKTLTKEQYETQFPGKTLEDGKENIKLYNTSRGLHTDKTAEVSELESEFADEDEAGARTFDVTLESWVADENLADVGLVLDASGSMAFTSDLVDTDIVTIDQKLGKFLLENAPAETANGVQWLESEQVNQILNKNYTSNSLLDYSDYSFFVYDGRRDTQEYVPLGYWDGTTEDNTAGGDPYDTLYDGKLNQGLVGYYAFDTSETRLNNLAPKASAGTKAKLDGSAGYETTKKVGNTGSSLKLYDTSGDHSGKRGNLTLDVHPDAKNFTVSFAVYTDQTGNTVYGKGVEILAFQNILDITGGQDYEGPFLSFVRGDRTKGINKSDRMKGYMLPAGVFHSETETGRSEVFNDQIFKAGSEWKVLTYVVQMDEGTNQTQVTSYIDGALWGTRTANATYLTGPVNFIFGGENKSDTAILKKADMRIDEIYVYDRALDADEVRNLNERTINNQSKENTETDSKVTVATKEGKTKIAGVHAAFQTDLGELSEEERAGWYYVNSNGSDDIDNKIDELGTSKELRGLIQDPNYKFNDAVAMEKADDGSTIVTYKGEPPWKEGTNKDAREQDMEAGPCKFYLVPTSNDQYRLCCAYSPTNKVYAYSYVYYKPDDDKIKREKLQEAVGDFVTELKQYSPESQVAAVRFSTESYFGTYTDKLNMLNWTSDPNISSAVMNLAHKNGINGGEGEQYDYLLTGGTNVVTGLQSFKEHLLDGENLDPKFSDDSKVGAKYLIIFTDGIDNSIGGKTIDQVEDLTDKTNDAIKITKELKENDWIIYCIMLPSTGQPMDGPAAKFLEKLSSKDPKDEKEYVFDATEGLQKAFSDISREITYYLPNYSVQDYIDPRFDLIAEVDGEKKLIHLNASGDISYEALPGSSLEHSEIPGNFKKNGLGITVDGSGEAKDATLHWDTVKKMYYLEWTGQTIPGCSVGSSALNVWNATITLRAKEDFIGGNAVLTNGEDTLMNYVHAPDEKASSGTDDADLPELKEDGSLPEGTDMNPSKGFPRVTVNVGMLPRDIKDVETMYLGQKIEPLEIAKKMVQTLAESDGSEEEGSSNHKGSHYYWEYLDRYVKKHSDIYSDLETLLKKLMTPSAASSTEELLLGDSTPTYTLSIPYSYLQAAGDSPDTLGGREEDALGILRYSWEELPGIQNTGDPEEVADENGSYVTLVTDSRKYKMSVEYLPATVEDEVSVTDTTAAAPVMVPNRESANNQDLIKETKTESDKVYAWDKTYKPAAGSVQGKDDEGNKINITGSATKEINIVHGELALEVVAEKGYLRQWFANHPEGSTLDVTVNVERSYELPILSTSAAQTTNITGSNGTQTEAETEKTETDETALSPIGLSAADQIVPIMELESSQEVDSPITENEQEAVPINASNKEDWNKPLVVSIKETDLETAETDAEDAEKLHFYSYVDGAGMEIPQERPIGKYTLTLAEDNDGAFQKLNYAERERIMRITLARLGLKQEMKYSA